MGGEDRERPEAEMSKEGHQGPLVTGARPGGWAHGPKMGALPFFTDASLSQLRIEPAPASPLAKVSPFCPPPFPGWLYLPPPCVTVSLEAWSPAQAVGLSGRADGPLSGTPPSLVPSLPRGPCGNSPEAGAVES